MQAKNYPMDYKDRSGVSIVDSARRLPYDKAGVYSDGVSGYFQRNGERLRLLGCTTIESASVPQMRGSPPNDNDLIDQIYRLLGQGHNLWCLRALEGRKWKESALNWGIWKYDSLDPQWSNPAARWELEEAALIQLDKQIAYGFNPPDGRAGFDCINICLEDSGMQVLMRHPDAHGIGTYQGRGMQWSRQARQMLWDFQVRIFTRVNTITGIRYCDDKRIIWGINNEQFIDNAYFRHTPDAWGSTKIVGTLSAGNAVVQNIADTSWLRVGWELANLTNFIKDNPTIQSIDSPTQITLSSAASVVGSGTGKDLPLNLDWFDKIVDGIADDYGDNGSWNTELVQLIQEFARLPVSEGGGGGWEVPAWGRGSTGIANGQVGFPRWLVWNGWATQDAKNKICDFIIWRGVEFIDWYLNKMTALREDILVSPTTWLYSNPQAYALVNPRFRKNIWSEKHQYFNDYESTGAKKGQAVTRPSITDKDWGYVRNGTGWSEALGGTACSWMPFINKECGQYSPNMYRHERTISEALACLLGGYDFAVFNEAQQWSITQSFTDGRGPVGDNFNVGSSAQKLAIQAVAPAVRYGFMRQYDTMFLINASDAFLRPYQYVKGTPVIGNRLNASPLLTGTQYTNDGTENAVWGGKRVRFDMNPALPDTLYADFTAGYPKLARTTIEAGTFVRDDLAGNEKIYVKRAASSGGFMLWWSKYWAGSMNIMMNQTAQDAIFKSPFYFTNVTGTGKAGYAIVRSNGPYPLFTGPMMLFLAGSDTCDNVVNQGQNVTLGPIGGVAPGAYGQGVPDAFAAGNPPGLARFMGNDRVTVYYAGSTSQNWGNGNSDPATTWQMLPERCTVNLDTTNLGLLPAGTDLELFSIDNQGLPTRLASRYNASTKVWSFDYDASSPRFMLQPKGGAVPDLDYFDFLM